MAEAPPPSDVLPASPVPALHELLALAPADLAVRLHVLAADVELAYAKNTLRAWRASWRVWGAYCHARGVAALLADLDAAGIPP